MVRFMSLFLLAATFGSPLMAQLSVKISVDTVLAKDQEAKIIVTPGKQNVDYTCVARKGGGDFSDFKYYEGPDGPYNEATFTSPFPGDTEIDVLDGKFNRVGRVTINVAAPSLTILEEEMINNIKWQDKTMPVIVQVFDQREQPIKTAKLQARLSEIVGRKTKATTSKVTDFRLEGDRYVATITGLVDASYKLEVFDEAHLQQFDLVESDHPYPSAVIEGLNISF